MTTVTDDQKRKVFGNVIDERVAPSIVRFCEAGIMSANEARELIGLPTIETAKSGDDK